MPETLDLDSEIPRILIGEIVDSGRRIWVLSDPDIIANRGFGRGDNAALSVAVVDRLRANAGSSSVYRGEGEARLQPDLAGRGGPTRAQVIGVVLTGANSDGAVVELMHAHAHAIVLSYAHALDLTRVNAVTYTNFFANAEHYADTNAGPSSVASVVSM